MVDSLMETSGGFDRTLQALDKAFKYDSSELHSYKARKEIQLDFVTAETFELVLQTIKSHPPDTPCSSTWTPLDEILRNLLLKPKKPPVPRRPTSLISTMSRRTWSGEMSQENL